MDSLEKRKIILEHYQHPKNKGLIEDNSYFCSNTSNESCIDEVNLMVKIENKKIIDIKFDGEACAICTSSTSIMIDTLIGKTIDEVIEIYNNLENMIENKQYDKSKLGKIVVYDDIAKQANRKKCVLLPWWGIKKIIDNIDNNY